MTDDQGLPRTPFAGLPIVRAPDPAEDWDAAAQADRWTAQQAPYPHELAALVDALVYKPGWSFELRSMDRGQGSLGLTLNIVCRVPNSYDHDTIVNVSHLMPVPPAAFTKDNWRRWLLEQIILVERHEACEFFTIDGSKPYAPLHGPGENPYTIREVSTPEQVDTNFRGDRS